MNVAASVKKPVKALFTRFPVLDVFSRRFLWRWIYRRLFFHEPEMKFFYDLPRDSIDIALDIGAAMGSYCWILNGRSRKIYAFEPGRVHNKCLNRMAFATNIEVVRAAVGNSSGKVRLFTPGGESTDRYAASVSAANPIIQSSAAIVDDVDQITLDEFFSSLVESNRSIDFIKIDVEGYELETLTGAVGILKKYRPLVICEIEARHNPNYAKVFGLMKGLGYSTYMFKDGSFKPFLEDRIEHLQLAEDLEKRLHGSPAVACKYINNFVFQRPDSKIQVA